MERIRLSALVKDVEMGGDIDVVIAADAQRALDVEREKVKALEEWQRVVVGTGTDQEAVVRMAATEYTKTAVQCWKDENAKLTAQLATLQAQLPAEMPGCTILFKECEKGHGRLTATNWIDHGCGTCALESLKAQLTRLEEEYAEKCVAKDNYITTVIEAKNKAKAQLRQVEGERDAHAQDVDDLIDCCINDVLVTHATPGGKPHDPDPQIRPLRDKIAGSLVELQTLRQLVEALPVVDGRMDVACGACYYIRSFIAGQYGVVCGLMTEQSTAMAIKTLLEYRAVLAAQDPPHPTEEQS